MSLREREKYGQTAGGDSYRNGKTASFLFCPLIDNVTGFPRAVDPRRFTLIAPFTKRRERWIRSRCVNIFDGKSYRLALFQNSKLNKVIPQTYGYILRLYLFHPESKSLGPDGIHCSGETFGLLKRVSIEANNLRYVGKETDRRWEQGEDLSIVNFQSTEYSPTGKMGIADETVINLMAKHGMREMMRKSGMSQHTIEIIRNRKPVRLRTLAVLKKALEG